uniref:Guanine nucleotide exchange factor MSS4 n=1 Tax=Ursus maritimus TaxID=29073 RepID=A0A452TFV1_URSMA
RVTEERPGILVYNSAVGLLISFSFQKKLPGRGVKCEQMGLFLPSMRKKPALADGSNPDGDLLQEHWLVEDMFIFENVGFTKDVGNIKFLVCADCEIGPIGWHCLDDKNSFYVALERVSHE